jgi:ATP-dependent Zn protease
MSASEFVNGYIGLGAKKVKILFEEVDKNSP